METFENPQFTNAAAVVVRPYTLASLDIVKIALQVDGKFVAPLSSTLSPTVLTNRLGASVTKHSGEVLFQLDVFQPGSELVFTMIPATGYNRSYTLKARELELLR